MNWVGVLLTFIFSAGAVGLGHLFFRRWMAPLDRFAKLGICGILGLGCIGLLTLPVGLLPDGLRWGMAIVWLLAAAGIVHLLILRPKLPRKPGPLEMLLGLPLIVCVLFALVAVLTPSNSLDWDTIAYHLAVPKLWLQAGHIYPIDFIHHSNFPLSVDNLYIWGLSWGGQAGAKAFQLCLYLLGIYVVFGLARQLYGNGARVVNPQSSSLSPQLAGGWAALAFASVPVVMWEAGTAYIDIAHGLFTGVGVILAVLALSEYSLWPLAGFCLGFAAGSKYTGLQAFIAVAVVLGGYALLSASLPSPSTGHPRHASPTGPSSTFVALKVLVLALAVCSPWYVKNEIWVGNPVYPFFYERFGGKNWNQYNADIYRNQQQVFGIPRAGQPLGGIAELPYAVMGLAMAGGRYTDPMPQLQIVDGQPEGAFGFAWQGTGAAIIATAFVWMFSGRIKRFEGLLLGWVAVSFLMWFVLSQQSRYVVSFAPILAVLLAGAVVRLRAGPVLAFVLGAQAVLALAVLYSARVKDQLPVVVGRVSSNQYLEATEPFYSATEWLNQKEKDGKVALFDEVHGFYLDIPYFWANPGHTTLIGYDRLNNGFSFVQRLKEMGFTCVYVDLRTDPDLAEHLGIGAPAIPFRSDQASVLLGDPGQKYKWLLSDAAVKGLYSFKRPFRSGVVMGLR